MSERPFFALSSVPGPESGPDTLYGYMGDWLEHQRLRHGFPGLSAAILRGGGVCAFRQAFGVADMETGEPLTPSHVFRAASHAKIATAGAVLLLADQGLLDLDAPVADRLPFLRQVGPAAEALTARRLLAHGAGLIRDGQEADFWQGQAPFPDRAALARLCAAPESLVSGGPSFKYSNIGYALLGLLIEAASGQPYGTYITERLLPLLPSVEAAPDSDALTAQTPRAQGHGAAWSPGGRKPIPCYQSTGALAASTGLCAHPYALAHLLADMLCPEPSLLSPAALRTMTAPGAPIHGMVPDRHYGCGVIVDRAGARTLYSHIGLWPGHMTKTYYDPAHDTSFSVAVNCVDGNPEFLLRGMMAILEFFLSQTVPEPDLIPFAGRYHALYAVKDVVPFGDRLYIVSPDLQDPFSNPAVLRREKGSIFRIVSDHGFGAQGETATFGAGPEATLNIAGVTYRRQPRSRQFFP